MLHCGSAYCQCGEYIYLGCRVHVVRRSGHVLTHSLAMPQLGSNIGPDVMLHTCHPQQLLLHIACSKVPCNSLAWG